MFGRTTLFVDLSIELLEIREVRREQVLDHVDADVRQLAELRDHARQQHDHEVRAIRLHAIILQRQDLVARGREPHHAVAMKRAVLVDVAAWKSKRKLSLERHQPLTNTTVACSYARAGHILSKRHRSPWAGRPRFHASYSVSLNVMCST